MNNIRLTLEYDGTRYLGWQRPKKDGASRTVSYKLTETLARLLSEEITLYAGAKTEAHVHAAAQTVSFTTHTALSPAALMQELNGYLPQDIRILDAQAAPERFRADLNAQARTYEYRICTAPVYDIFTAKYTAHLFPCPDVEKMRQMAASLTGTHDFQCFSSVGKKKKSKNTIRRLDAFDISVSSDQILLTLTADDFLLRMPALLIEAVLQTGVGNLHPLPQNWINGAMGEGIPFAHSNSTDGTHSAAESGSVAEDDCVTKYRSAEKRAEALFQPKGLLLRQVLYL